MPSRYETAAAFRQALEQRLGRAAAERHVPLGTLRLNIAIERLLARLFATAAPPWLLKGGYAMELRYQPQARATTDIDLSVVAATSDDPISQIRDHLQGDAGRDLGDFFVFRIGPPSAELQGAPGGGARFPVNAVVAGRTFARFHVDVGIGDTLIGEPERLVGDDLLAFAEIAPATVLAIPLPQQFAEKLHAFTFPWSDRPNTRAKDLADLVLLIERGRLDPARVADAVRRTFAARRTHVAPTDIPEPPEAWAQEFEAMARETGIAASDLATAHLQLSQFWIAVRAA